MKRLFIILKSIWMLDQLERRMAVLEGELALRVAQLEAQAIADKKRDDKALLYMSRSVPKEKRLEHIETTLNMAIARRWPT